METGSACNARIATTLDGPARLDTINQGNTHVETTLTLEQEIDAVLGADRDQRTDVRQPEALALETGELRYSETTREEWSSNWATIGATDTDGGRYLTAIMPDGTEREVSQGRTVPEHWTDRRKAGTYREENAERLLRRAPSYRYRDSLAMASATVTDADRLDREIRQSVMNSTVTADEAAQGAAMLALLTALDDSDVSVPVTAERKPVMLRRTICARDARKRLHDGLTERTIEHHADTTVRGDSAIDSAPMQRAILAPLTREDDYKYGQTAQTSGDTDPDATGFYRRHSMLCYHVA